MSGSFLLDTNIVIALFGGDALVKKRVATDSKFFIPCLVLGELQVLKNQDGLMKT